MNRRKALIASAAAAGLVVLTVASVAGYWAAASSDPAAASSSDPVVDLSSDPAAVSSSDPEVGPASDAEVMSAFDDDLRPATQPAPIPTVAPGDDGAGDPPDVTVDDRRRIEVNDATNELLGEILPVVAIVDASEPVDVVARFSDIASQAILSELEAERLEFESQGWSREGSYRVDGVEVLSYSEADDSASATVRVCLDSSEIVVRRSDGAVVEPGADSQRAWNVYVLERTAETWRLVGRTFTDDPAC